MEFENALGNGFEKYSLGRPNFLLGRVSLGLLHRGVVSPCNSPVQTGWITFTGEPIWYRIGETMESGSARSCINLTTMLGTYIRYNFQVLVGVFVQILASKTL